MSNRRRGLARAAATAGSVLLAASMLSACTGGAPSTPTAQQTAAQHFLDEVGKGDVAKAAAATDDAARARRALAASIGGLGVGTKGSFDVTNVTTKGDTASADFNAYWKLAAVTQPWQYQGTLALTEQDGTWRVDWRPTDLHPLLTANTHLMARFVQPARADLDDSAGHPLFTATPVVRVGVEPKLITNLLGLARTLARIPQLQSTGREIITAVRAAAPTDFVPIITLRRPAYARIRAQIHNLPGTVFQSATELLGPTAHFGQPLLGGVGDATAEQITRSKGRLQDGAQTGTGGLQQALDRTLAGTPGVTITTAAYGSDEPVRQLATLTAANPGKPVRLTIDRRIQNAAEASLAGVRLPATVVAVQRSTGRILADANSLGARYDLGLDGAFPAGSTFKIVTYSAAFAANNRLSPSSIVACPPSTVVDGRTFVNENGFSYPPIPVSDAFGYSCNTSAIRTALGLPNDALQQAARKLGLGQEWTLPVDSFAGSLPSPASQTERAADAIGQGRVQVSPLLMALIAGNAATGASVAPSLVAGRPVVRTPAQTGPITTRMNALLRATVDLPSGTGHDLSNVGGAQGKTGTAEYGDAVPPRSHSWFAGSRGDLAFAVFVYDGASRQVDAVPIADRFLLRLR